MKSNIIRRTSLCLFAWMFFISGISANAQVTYEFQEGLNGYSGTVDTFFQTGDAGSIHGDALEWEFDGADAGGINYGMLSFENIFGSGANQIPIGSNVLEAYLSLTVTNNGSAGATVHESLLPFDEEMGMIDFTLNFDMIAGEEYDEEVIATLPGLTAGDVVQVDVTSSLQKWAADGEYNGWIFIPGGTDGAGIQSSEASVNTSPTLVIDTPLGEFRFTRGLNGYQGIVDTYINTGTGFETVYGETGTIGWDGDDAGGQSFGLIRFDDIFGSGPNQIPPGTTINSAELMLSIVDPGNEAEIHEILEGSEDEPTTFDETSTSMFTWGDTISPRPGVDYDDEIVAIIPGEVGNVSVEVTSSIQKYSDGEENRGWIIVPTGGGGVDAISSNQAPGSGPPRLTVIIEGTSTGVYDFSLY